MIEGRYLRCGTAGKLSVLLCGIPMTMEGVRWRGGAGVGGKAS